MSDERFMRRALELAGRETRRTLPNPSVGAVVVKGGHIIGEGYHQGFGQPHAEVNAINSVSDQSKLAGATIYVTLEPCSHYGKTPPCADLLIRSGISSVVIGCLDPYDKVAGAGVERLQAAGMKVKLGVLHDECLSLNKRFILARKERRPYIILKWAQTADRFIAPEDGARMTISSPQSHHLLHYWRGQEMAIAVGANTARIDDPSLTVRYTELYTERELPPIQPLRVVIGDTSKLPDGLKLWGSDAPTLAYSNKPGRFFGPTVSLSICDTADRLIQTICEDLYQREVLSIIIEGGTTTLSHFIETGLWDEARVFTCPMMLYRGMPAPDLGEVAPSSITTSGTDLLEIYYHPDLPKRLGMTGTTRERISSLCRSSVFKPLLSTT
jgi:diaminohydroxyphosphoribosylaminopyrimidine deaminase/5-amino-6-(5-phosphoribosylamino)uracil reductase